MSARVLDVGACLALARLSRRRDMLAWGEVRGWGAFTGGLVTPRVLRALVREGFADLAERQNDGPTIATALRFAESLSGVVLGIYMVNFARSDRRVTCDSVVWRGEPEPGVRGPWNAVPAHVKAAFNEFVGGEGLGPVALSARRWKSGTLLSVTAWWD